ncbi:MAG: hypothetical protein KAR01_03825 [Desulfocapsa sp.]|nr:hypothetical protein [Desulfocapsa sp.]
MEKDIEAKLASCQQQLSELQKQLSAEKTKNEQQLFTDRMESLSRLARGVSHEIRNPLASIMLFVDILADPGRYSRTDQELEILSDVKENVNKITTIITRIFDFSKGDSSQKLPTDINELLEDALEISKSKLQQKAIHCVLSLEDNIPHVAGDSLELQQVFKNLILNAIESMPGGGAINITTKSLYSGTQQKMVFMSIEDVGEGIPHDALQSIFTPFFSTKPGQPGLGLTISHQIVHRHGGILTCSTSGKQGTTFTLELPVKENLLTEEKEL